MKKCFSIKDNFKIDLYHSYDDTYHLYLDDCFYKILNLNGKYSFENDMNFLEEFSNYLNINKIKILLKFYIYGLYLEELYSFIEIFDLQDCKNKIYLWIKDNQKYIDYYSDNFRIAIKDDETNLIYNYRKSKGCCGFVDEEIIFKDKTILIGFNFGH
jgi:hypothetical protein